MCITFFNGIVSYRPHLGRKEKQRGRGAKEAPGAESSVCGEDQEPTHFYRRTKGSGQRKEEGGRWQRRTCECWHSWQIKQQSLKYIWCVLNFFFHPQSVRKEETWMILSTMTLMRTYHWRKRRRERAVAVNRRIMRMERRRKRRGGGEHAGVCMKSCCLSAR